MLFIPYRNIVDLARDFDHSAPRRRLTWDEIDFELGVFRMGACRRALTHCRSFLSISVRGRVGAHNTKSLNASGMALDRSPQA